MKLTTTQPRDWIKAFKAQAKKEKMTLSEWMGKTCAGALPRKIKLSKRQGVGPRKKLKPKEKK